MTKKLINIFLISTTIVFIFYYLYKNFDYHTILNIRYNFIYLALSFVILIFQIIYQSIIWSVLIRTLKPNIKIIDSMKIWLLSLFGKYVPGKIAGYALLFYLYKDYSVNKSDLSIASYYELISSIVSIMITSLLFLVFVGESLLNIQEIVIIIGLALAFSSLLIPKVLELFLGIVTKILKRDKIFVKLKIQTIIKITLLYCISNVVLGFAFYFFINSISFLEITKIPYLILVINLSGFIGLLAFFMPAGIGAREGALIYFLNKIISFQVATMISIISRLWFVISEFITLSLAYLFLKYFGHIDVLGIINKSTKEIEIQ